MFMASEKQILYLSMCVNLLRMLKSYYNKSIRSVKKIELYEPDTQDFNYMLCLDSFINYTEPKMVDRFRSFCFLPYNDLFKPSLKYYVLTNIQLWIRNLLLHSFQKFFCKNEQWKNVVVVTLQIMTVTLFKMVMVAAP